MNRILRALSRRLMGLRSSREDIEALDEAISARRRGTLPVGELRARHRSEVSGVLRAITFRPSTDKPVLVGQLFDGTGSVDLVWIGRRSIAGIHPGAHLRAEGMVVAGRTRPTIYNPSYEILAPGA
ncbi:OB-fold nucleic acid binding domain-containing protein [Actinomyces sp. oral taxon 448]|jgi:nucleic acid binding protein|uniref:OB-fold nucleic acid binding domain-containing protein n=1 Tax=Actinomyces sp. oral taxon 448 TaxID=712124 RepID=UPI0025BAE22C|nr:OB-fold nucleic acid binding domain-containing protein [Actinomyces sp. oral taxon 448]